MSSICTYLTLPFNKVYIYINNKLSLAKFAYFVKLENTNDYQNQISCYFGAS